MERTSAGLACPNAFLVALKMLTRNFEMHSCARGARRERAHATTRVSPANARSTHPDRLVLVHTLFDRQVGVALAQRAAQRRVQFAEKALDVKLALAQNLGHSREPSDRAARGKSEKKGETYSEFIQTSLISSVVHTSSADACTSAPAVTSGVLSAGIDAGAVSLATIAVVLAGAGAGASGS